jgi:hypothetical protein
VLGEERGELLGELGLELHQPLPLRRSRLAQALQLAALELALVGEQSLLLLEPVDRDLLLGLDLGLLEGGAVALGHRLLLLHRLHARAHHLRPRDQSARTGEGEIRVG